MELGDAVEDFFAVGVFGEFFVFLVQLGLEVVDRAAGGDVVPDGDVGVFGRDGDFLGEVAEAKVVAEIDFAVIELLLAEDDAEKSGFAGAVDADDADFVAGFEMKITVIVDDFGAVSEMKMGGFHGL